MEVKDEQKKACDYFGSFPALFALIYAVWEKQRAACTKEKSGE